MRTLFSFLVIALSTTLLMSEQDTTKKITATDHVPQSNHKTGSPTITRVAIDQIGDYAYEVVDSLLKPLGYTFETASPHQQAMIASIVNTITSKRTTQAQRANLKFIDKAIIISDISKEISPILDNPSDLVNATNINIKTNDAFEELCIQKQLDSNLVPHDMHDELETLKQIVATSALAEINEQPDGAINAQDLYALVSLMMSGYVDRVKYALIMQWANLLSDNNKATRGGTPSSLLAETPESKDLFKRMRFLQNELARPVSGSKI